MQFLRAQSSWRIWLVAGGLSGLALLGCAHRAVAQTIARLPPATQSTQKLQGQVITASAQALTSADVAVPGASLPYPGEAQPAEPIGAPAPYYGVSDLERQASAPIDLPTALQLADRANPEIGISRQAILEAMALQMGARVILLPSLTGGTNYHLHNGNLQRSRGSILSLSEQSLYFGGGARTVAAESVAYPAIRIFGHLGDAMFEPLAARQQTAARQFTAGATFNSVLLSVSTRYIELMAAEAQLEVLLESHVEADELARITKSFAVAGQGRQADADRMQTEAMLIDSAIERARGDRAVAAAELARLLNLDPSVRLRTVGGPVPLIDLVDRRYDVEELIDVALRQRPELAARNADIATAETRYRQERTRPLLPTISVGFSAGDFGGGSNLVSPVFGRFAGRTDFDAMAFWTAQNLGVGNAALWRTRRAQLDQTISARTRTVNLIRREITEAHAQADSAREQFRVAERRLAIAADGFVKELNRIRGGEGLPIELLDNFTRLLEARQAVVTAASVYDQAQFRLFVALGQPPTLAEPNFSILRLPPTR